MKKEALETCLLDLNKILAGEMIGNKEQQESLDDIYNQKVPNYWNSAKVFLWPTIGMFGKSLP